MRTMKCKHYTSGPDGQQLISNDVISLHKAYDGKLWIGTSQGLCFLKTNNGNDVFHWIEDNDHNGIMNVHNIQEDVDHNIWVSTSNGIRLVLKNLSTIRLTYRDGLQGNEFADGAVFVQRGEHCLFWWYKGHERYIGQRHAWKQCDSATYTR